MKPLVLLDVDGVVVDFATPCHALAEDVLGRRLLPPSRWRAWEVSPALGLDPYEAAKLEAAMRDPSNGLDTAVQPYPGASEGIELLEKHADIAFVTTSMRGHPRWAHTRTELLEANWPGVPIIQTSAKSMVKGDYLVDDGVHNLGQDLRGTREWIPLLWSRPWNRNHGGAPYTRVSSWDELVLVVRT